MIVDLLRTMRDARNEWVVPSTSILNMWWWFSSGAIPFACRAASRHQLCVLPWMGRDYLLDQGGELGEQSTETR